MKEYNRGKLENGLFYTDSDILKMYTEASNRREQLKILAELNLCPRDVIKEVLIRAGFTALADGLYYTDAELLDMYTKNTDDKQKYLRKLAQMNLCEVDHIKNALIRAGLDRRRLPRQRKKDSEIVSVPEVPTVVEDSKEPLEGQSTEVNIVSTDHLIDDSGSNTTAQTKILEFIQKAASTYQGSLVAKKIDLLSKISELEKEISILKKEVSECDEELLLYQSIFHN